MNLVVVGMGDCRIAAGPGEMLTTYALGSCIAVTVCDPVAAVGGLLHFMLPDSAIDPAGCGQSPFKYADTGIPMLLELLAQAGGNRKRLIVRVVGGAQIVDPDGVFNIGHKNYQALRRLLWKAGLLLHGEWVGGTRWRCVRMEVSTGRLWLREATGPEMEVPLQHSAR
jgi:chemotaxis protein CheD